MDEQHLAGGLMNTVVRVGDTVRRLPGRWTPTVHRVLAHARQRGVHWVPEPRGYDEHGREVLSFIAGEVPHQMPPWVWSDDVLRDVMAALRAWHDVTVDFDTAGAVWNAGPNEPREVICHNDFAPYNCAFRARRFAGAFDFDLCSPGPRLWDIAYTAYRFVPLMPPAGATVDDREQERSPFDVQQMTRRLAAAVAVYSGPSRCPRFTPAQTLAMVVRRLEAAAAWTDSHVRATGDATLIHHGRMYRAHAAWLDAGGLGEAASPGSRRTTEE